MAPSSTLERIPMRARDIVALVAAIASLPFIVLTFWAGPALLVSWLLNRVARVSSGVPTARLYWVSTWITFGLSMLTIVAALYTVDAGGNVPTWVTWLDTAIGVSLVPVALGSLLYVRDLWRRVAA